uniref:Uncharacterized protein n=1 Tax=Romanomermis culicivorax TaxID=13658 RepID=A0A915I3A5_ROMCU
SATGSKIGFKFQQNTSELKSYWNEVTAQNLVNLGERDQQHHTAPDPVNPDQTPARVQPMQQQAMHFMPQDSGVPIVHPPTIALDLQRKLLPYVRGIAKEKF